MPRYYGFLVPWLVWPAAIAAGQGVIVAPTLDSVAWTGPFRDIVQAEFQLRRAQLATDTAALGRLYADTYFHSNLRTRTADKGARLELFAVGEYRVHSLEHSDVRIAVYGSTAVVTSVVHSLADLHGNPVDLTYRLITVWARQRGRWRVVAQQATEVPPDHPPP